jgi:DNA-binding winged helix-turn-helix (wHTH) protein
MERERPDDPVFSFGPFRLHPKRQLLLKADAPVDIGSRALEVLTVLLERAGELVTKNDLLALVRPSTVVDEGNLRAQIAALRRVLENGRGLGKL